jgi:hypothetical protein
MKARHAVDSLIAAHARGPGRKLCLLTPARRRNAQNPNANRRLVRRRQTPPLIIIPVCNRDGDVCAESPLLIALP